MSSNARQLANLRFDGSDLSVLGDKIITGSNFPRDLRTFTTPQLVNWRSYQDTNISFNFTANYANSSLIMLWRVGGYWSPNGDAIGRVLRDGSVIYTNERMAGNQNTQHETCAFWIIDNVSQGTYNYKLQMYASGTGTFDINHGVNYSQVLIMEVSQ